MKAILFWMSIVFCIVASFGVRAIPADKTSPTTQEPHTVVLKPKATSQRPNAPNGNFIICIYTNNEIQLKMPEHIHSSILSIIKDNTVILQGIVTQSKPSVSILHLSGIYTLYCSASDNKTYIATIDI